MTELLCYRMTYALTPLRYFLTLLPHIIPLRYFLTLFPYVTSLRYLLQLLALRELLTLLTDITY